MSSLRPTDVLIDDNNWHQHVSPMVDGEIKGHGCVPRDRWVDRIRERDSTKTRLSDVRRSSGPGGGPIPSLDQDGVGYCWNHSTTMAIMMVRALLGLPYVRLSAFFIGCLVKNYRDEGGWGAQSLDFAMKNGIPSVAFWPEKSMSRSNDTLECRANAKLHMPIEVWADLSAGQYDRNLTEDQAMTCLLCRVPVVSDFNWWSHSVCALDPVLLTSNVRHKVKDLGSLDFNDPADVAVFAATFGKRIINSWTDSYGDKGEAVLSGSRCILDGGVAPRSVFPSAA
jgi:hypothetical protein